MDNCNKTNKKKMLEYFYETDIREIKEKYSQEFKKTILGDGSFLKSRQIINDMILNNQDAETINISSVFNCDLIYFKKIKNLIVGSLMYIEGENEDINLSNSLETICIKSIEPYAFEKDRDGICEELSFKILNKIRELKNIKSLYITDIYIKSLYPLNTLESLELEDCYLEKYIKNLKANDDNLLPPNLKFLRLRDRMNINNIYSINYDLLNNRCILNLNSLIYIEFEQTIEIKPNMFPNSLQYLTLYRYNNCIKKNTFPPNLIYLKMENYDKKLQKNILPNSLRTLHMDSYRHNIEEGVLPKSLEIITVGKTCVIDRIPFNIRYLRCDPKLYSKMLSPNYIENNILIEEDKDYSAYRVNKYVFVCHNGYDISNILVVILATRRKNKLFLPSELYEYIWYEYLRVFNT